MCSEPLEQRPRKINPKSLVNLSVKHERKWLSSSPTTTIRIPVELKNVILKIVHKTDKILHENPNLLETLTSETEDLSVIPVKEMQTVLDNVITKRTKQMLVDELRTYFEKYIPEFKNKNIE